MQPPSDQDKKSNPNPFTPRSPWPRAPQQTFHLQVPKGPKPGVRPPAAPPPATPAAAQPAPRPAPPRPAPASPEDRAMPVGYADPLGAPQMEAFEPEADVDADAVGGAAPPFVAPPAAPFATRPRPRPGPRRVRREGDSRTPLLIAGAVTAVAAAAAIFWLTTRGTDAPALDETLPAAPAPAQPVITEPSLDYIAPSEDYDAPDLSLPAPVETAPAPTPAPVTPKPQAVQPAPARPAVKTPAKPIPYSAPTTSTAPSSTAPAPAQTAPVITAPPPPLPPVSAPGPSAPLADPDAPIVTRDPSSGR